MLPFSFVALVRAHDGPSDSRTATASNWETKARFRFFFAMRRRMHFTHPQLRPSEPLLERHRQTNEFQGGL